MEKIFITKNDQKKLIDLIDKKWPNDDYDQALLEELKRAEIIEPEDIPKDVITMNSLASLCDLDNGKVYKYWLVMPEEADVSQDKISILSPLGCALLGYRIGDVIPIKAPAGERRLEVKEILHQPEAIGKYD
jgi:regulator of nucleoside diphosphate kinase